MRRPRRRIFIQAGITALLAGVLVLTFRHDPAMSERMLDLRMHRFPGPQGVFLYDVLATAVPELDLEIREVTTTTASIEDWLDRKSFAVAADGVVYEAIAVGSYDDRYVALTPQQQVQQNIIDSLRRIESRDTDYASNILAIGPVRKGAIEPWLVFPKSGGHNSVAPPVAFDATDARSGRVLLAYSTEAGVFAASFVEGRGWTRPTRIAIANAYSLQVESNEDDSFTVRASVTPSMRNWLIREWIVRAR